jgi:uncharacterized protein (TIGR04206 family)
MAHGTPRRRLFVIAALGVLPWTVLAIGSDFTFVFGVGLFNTDPPQFVDLYRYLFVYTAGPSALPEYLLAWPTSLLLYLGALASGLGGLFGHEDRRVTAGLLVVAGFTQLSVAWGLSRVGARLAVPIGTAVFWSVVWWFYWPDVRAMGPTIRNE